MKHNTKPKSVRAKVFWAVSYGDGNIDPYSIRHKRSDRRILRRAVHGGLAGVAQEGRKAGEGACAT